jgi:NAD(P)-dependent dehydrogenase (short-subunit alcohol dehydrogenase family)
MGEATDELKPHLNGHAQPATSGDDKTDDVSTIRAQIEDTRDNLSETIDALQNKLDPQRVKAQAIEKVHEATIERAQHLAHTAKEKLTEARDKVTTAARPALESATHFLHRGEEHDGTGSASTPSATGSFLKPIYEQVVVVFGASSGIGRETAIQFARRGTKVVVAARSEEGLSTLVESIERAGGKAAYQIADVADPEQVKAVAQKAVDTFGRLDTWVHCAAISIYATAENTTSEEFRRVHEVNFLGTVHGAQAALPHLKREGRGALICISSVEGKRAFPLQAAYSSSKHAIIAFLDALRVELKHEGQNQISVTNVMPAGINTPFFNQARTKLGVKPMPAPPIYHPSVVAETILHAAENPTRDICAGGASKMLVALQRLSPALLDAMVLRMGFEGQKTSEPKPEGAPDNLYAPIESEHRIGGDFPNKAKTKSMGTWLETHPKTQRALKGAAVGLAFVWLLQRKR